MSVPYDELIVGLALVAMLAGTLALVRFRVEHEPIVVLDLALREGAIADLVGWARHFLSLQALERHGWRGLAFGLPWIAYEFRSEDGTIHARCAVPARQRQLVETLLRSAISGIEISDAP